MMKKQPMGTNAAKLTKYAFVLGSAATLVGRAAAQTAAQFTFENSYSTGAAGTVGSGASTGASSGMLTAEVGTGTAIGVHASASTVYSFLAGYGSSHALSSASWASGDYYQFSINAASFTSSFISFAMARSSTGPNGFSLQYSTSGSTGGFTTFNGTFTAGGTTTSGSAFAVASASFSATSQGATNLYNFDLSAVTSLSNDANDVFRLVSDGTNSSGGAVATTGTARVDDFTFGPSNGAAVPIATIPEPSTLALLSIAGAGAVMMITRRRKRA